MSKSHLLPIFSPLPVCFQKGEGVWLTDTQGNVYLDGFAGIAVNAVGHNHPRLVSALQKQVSELIHVSNYFRIDLQEEVAAKLCEKSGLRGCFFCNSGLEANEAAIKLARKYGYLKGFNEPKIIVFDHAFHGRSIATLSATGNPNVRRDFAPYLPDFIRVPAGDVELIEKLASTTPGICAVMFEPVQGEGGVQPLDADFVHKASELCREKDILLIFDEVQTGVGRTGKLYAWEHFGVRPDILTSAKGLGGGLPVGACLCVERLGAVMGPGTHGSTFGGNPIVCAGVCEVLSRMEEPLFQQVRQRGAFLRDTLSKCDEIVEIRGMGLMLGLVLQTKQAKAVAARCVERGLLVLTAKTLVRLLPPLTISQEELEQGIAILKEVLTEK